MPDTVDEMSDHDDAERARKQRVSAEHTIVFGSLFEALQGRVSRYNERHRQDFALPPAVSIDEEKEPLFSSKHSLKIQKNTEPRSSLTLDFPINSGAMQVEVSAKPQKLGGSVNLDIVNDTPTYYFGGKGHSAESLADLLLVAVLSSKEFLDAGRKIGFV